MTTARSRWVGMVLGLLVVPCMFADGFDLLYGVDPYALSGSPMAPPSWSHPLGTDDLGRDVLSRFLHGGRVSLLVAFLGAIVSVCLGGSIGVVAGYFGGPLEVGLMRFTETAMALPKLPLMLFLAGMDLPRILSLRSGPATAILTLVLIIGLFSWMDVARLARATTRRIRDQAFVLAAEGLGLPAWAVLRQHVLPHLVAPIGVTFAIEVGENVLYESSLTFLGLGVSTPTPSWGALLARGLGRLSDAPWLVILPGFCTFGLVAAVHALAEDLRVRGDPSTARLEGG